MASPVVTVSKLKFIGRTLSWEGTADFAGDPAGTVVFFLDPQPVGTPLGPFPLTPAGVNIAQANINLGRGKWKVRVVATPVTGLPTEVSSSELMVSNIKGRVIMPLIGGEAPADRPEGKTLRIGDAAARTQYSAAIAGAANGGKRNAAATVIRGTLGSQLRLDIRRNNRLVIRSEYNQSLLLTDNGTDVTLSLRGVTQARIVESADINSGRWTFELQGGLNFTRYLRGNVGPIGEDTHINLSESPIEGAGFNANFTILLPRAIDGLT